jgi:hypothetical protein
MLPLLSPGCLSWFANANVNVNVNVNALVLYSAVADSDSVQNLNDKR